MPLQLAECNGTEDMEKVLHSCDIVVAGIMVKEDALMSRPGFLQKVNDILWLLNLFAVVV